MRTHKVFTRVLLYLIAGSIAQAILAIVVAAMPLDSAHAVRASHEFWAVALSRWGKTRVICFVINGNPSNELTSDGHYAFAAQSDGHSLLLDSWLQLNLPIMGTTLDRDRQRPLGWPRPILLAAGPHVMDATGWPWRSLSCEVAPADRNPEHFVVSGGLLVGAHDRQIGTECLVNMVVLPYRILLLGFVANSIVYAICITIIIVVAERLYGAIRRRRGLCASCGYDLRLTTTMTCPECGAHHSPWRQTATRKRDGPT